MRHEYIVEVDDTDRFYDFAFVGQIRGTCEQLVRCKECKYDHTCTHEMVRRTESGGYIYCPVEYCSEGKRKEE